MGSPTSSHFPHSPSFAQVQFKAAFMNVVTRQFCELEACNSTAFVHMFAQATQPAYSLDSLCRLKAFQIHCSCSAALHKRPYTTRHSKSLRSPTWAARGLTQVGEKQADMTCSKHVNALWMRQQAASGSPGACSPCQLLSCQSARRLPSL